MNTRIERIEERLVYSDPKNPWIKLYFDRVQFPDGRRGFYNRIVETEGKEGIAILPIRGLTVGLVRQFRYPVGEEVWEIPRGFADTRDPKQEAIRELHEETGLRARPEALIDLGAIHPDSGVLASTVHLFALDCRGTDVDSPLDQKEVSKFQWFPLEHVLALIGQGEIKDAFTLCAILRARQRGLLTC